MALSLVAIPFPYVFSFHAERSASCRLDGRYTGPLHEDHQEHGRQ
jgi:hypothetical protein